MRGFHARGDPRGIREKRMRGRMRFFRIREGDPRGRCAIACVWARAVVSDGDTLG